MNAEEPQPRDPSHAGGGDPLDRLLAGARWPEPTAQSQQRLAAFWATVSPARERPGIPRLSLRRWAAAAAVLAIAGGILWFLASRQDRQRDRLVTPQPQAPVPPPPLDPERVDPRPAAPPVLVREPTTFEKIVAAQGLRRDLAKAAEPKHRARVDEAVARLGASPSSDPAAVAVELIHSTPPYVLDGRLRQIAQAGRGPRRTAAVKLLDRLQFPGTLPLMTELARSDDAAARAPAVQSLARTADPRTLAAVAKGQADASAVRVLAAALLDRAARGRPEATGLYLRLVNDRRTGKAALGALDSLPNPPAQTFLAQLNSRDAATRLAAARALGRINTPEVTAALAAMVRRDVHRREALAALLHSDRPEAERFLAAARRDPQIDAVLRSVKLQTRLAGAAAAGESDQL